MMKSERVIIAIDGPAASGKSTVARELAKRFGFSYMNSGSMYRAFTWYVLSRDGNPFDSLEVEGLLESAIISSGFDGRASYIEIDGVRPTADLLSEDVNRSVSAVSTVPAVRTRIFNELRTLASHHDVVIEGRDIGSVVFPETPFKFYLDAPQVVRQRRREAQGQKDEIALRDQIDSSRHTAPLVISPDAYVIDTGTLDLNGVLDAISSRLANAGLTTVSS
ncbi:MAG: (d)CMP kinase [Chthoniobacterales bacterium]